MWECGLKLVDCTIPTLGIKVTPYVGVWIETNCCNLLLRAAASLLMWECGLKLIPKDSPEVPAMSLLMWECGLKQCFC